MGNVALITCKAGTGNSGMPSKTWSIMACDTPIVASFDTTSDLAEVIKLASSGECVEPGNSKALVDAICNSYNSWIKGDMVKGCARDYVRKNASKMVCVQKYIEILQSVVKVSQD